MRHVSLLDETFDPGQASVYDLILTPHRYGIEVSVHDSVRKQFIAFIEFAYVVSDDTEWRDAFASLLKTYSWLAARFRSIRVGWRGRNYTLVPKEFFVPAEAKLLLERLSYVGEFDALYYNRVTEDIYLLFAIPSELINALLHTFSHFTVLHQEATLLRLGLQQFRKVSCLSLHLSQEFASATLFQGGSILRHTCFDATTATDVLYYVAALMDSAKVAQNTSYKIIGKGVRQEVRPSDHAPVWLSTNTVDTLVQEYYTRYDHRMAIAGHGFAYSLEPHREEALGLFSLIVGD
jgi:hypothetical protein